MASSCTFSIQSPSDPFFVPSRPAQPFPIRLLFLDNRREEVLERPGFLVPLTRHLLPFSIHSRQRPRCASQSANTKSLRQLSFSRASPAPRRRRPRPRPLSPDDNAARAMEVVDPLPPASGLSAPPPLQTSRSVPAFKDPRSKRTSPRSGAYAFTATNNYSSSSKDLSAAKWPTVTRERANTTTRIAPTTTPTPAKPLVPATERKTHEANKSSVGRSRKDSDLDGGSSNTNNTNKWDITPDGGSAGREGRQFAVANVGNNGRIYLRYVSFPLALIPKCLS